MLSTTTLLQVQSLAICSAEHAQNHNITHTMMLLMFQIAVLIFAAQIGGKIATKLKMPGVLGELGAGIVVGPFLLGRIPIPGLFEHGIFPLSEGSLSVSPELYGFAILASIILLFMSGLETDLRMFLRYSVAGSVIGIGGVVFSMLFGMCMGPLLGQSYTSPLSLFFGVLCVATSVGITARILSEKRKMDSSEGVTILAGAVIDDVLGIICLAVVMGIIQASSASAGGGLDMMQIAFIAVKAVGVWLVFSLLGLCFAHKISGFLKKYKHTGTMVTAAIGLTLILATIFECAGLAMIIGAYVMGLCLSKTDLKFILMERLHGFYEFLVPVFFAVMGALVDVTQFANVEVLKLGLIYSILAVAAKILGCALPALGLNFNWKGALRIGTGMVPRGEVALIIAGLGVSSGVLTPQYFGVAIIMTLATTLIAPPLLAKALELPGSGTRKEDKNSEDNLIRTVFPIPNPMIRDMIVSNIRQTFIDEGYFVNMMDVGEEIYQIRKNTTAFSLDVEPEALVFTSYEAQVPFIKMAVYENLIDFQHAISDLKNINTPDEIRHEVASAVMDNDLSTIDSKSLANAIHSDCIRLHMNVKTKEEALQTLVDVLGDAGVIKKRDNIFKQIMEREQIISTGMQDGVAIPHCRTDEVAKVHLAIGIVPEGIDFDSLDQKPTRLIALLLSPTNHGTDHLQSLAALGSIIIKPEFIEAVLNAPNIPEVCDLFKNYLRQASTPNR